MNIMKHSTDSHILNSKNSVLTISTLLLIFTAGISLFVGKYPLSLSGIINNEGIQRAVFVILRLSRVLVGVAGGIALGISGYVLQTILKNPLASPDIIGIASGASAGAAFGIIYFSTAFMTGLSSFVGALIAVIFVLILTSIDKSGKNETIILAGIGIHALAQTVLMCLKLIADPEKQLSSIEYWIMGSLNGISMNRIVVNMLFIVISLVLIIILYRQIILLSNNTDEAKMLGVDVNMMKTIIIIITTILVSSTISLTGLISFVGLLAPHIARKLIKGNKLSTLLLSGINGGIILCLADILARSVSSVELPVSIFTSLIGAPFLIHLLVRKRSL